MGVRRGWLSLLNPSIHDWNDVFKAFDRLLSFIDNLKDQVYIVRRSPFLIENEKLEKAFKALRDAIKNEKSKAESWMRSGLEPRNFDDKSRSDQMFNLYRTKFGDILEVHVKTRATSEYPYRSTRPANVTELLDRVLAILRDNIKAIKEEELEPDKREEWSGAAFKEFAFGNMKVIVTDPKTDGHLIKQYVKEIDKAFQLTNRKGFGKLWYGILFIESADYRKLDPHEIEAYKARGYADLRSVAGIYKSRKNIIAITSPPQGLARILVHELGHRYWYKIMGSAQRAKFEDLIKVYVPGKSGILTPKKVEGQLLTDLEKDIYSSFIKVGRAIEAFQKDNQFFPKVIGKAADILSDTVNNFAKIIVEAVEKLSTYVLPSEDPHAREEWQQLQKHLTACKEWVGKLFDLSNKIQSLPDGTDFQKVFDEERTEWIVEMQTRMMETEGVAYQLIIDLNELQNRKVEEAEKEISPHIDPNDPRSILPVSEYGKSNIDEAFAEVFEHYVTGKDMNRDQLESFRSVLASKKVSLAQQVVNRFHASL
jgi:hypothetical protein